MNLRDLRYLVTLADLRHFGRAAEACHVSQPALSGQIKKLEEELGVTLFERAPRALGVTPVGEAVIAAARAALDDVARIEAIARAARDPFAGPLRLGVIMTVAPYLLPLALPALKRAYPALQPEITEETTDLLMARLRRHEIDAAVIATEPDDDDLVTLPLFDELFLLAVAPGHPLDQPGRARLGSIDRDDLLLLADAHCLRDQVLGSCAFDPFRAKGALANLRASSLETLIQLVAAGHGWTLLPRMATERPGFAQSGVKLRAIEGEPGRSLRLAYRRSYPGEEMLKRVAEVIRRGGGSPSPAPAAEP